VIQGHDEQMSKFATIASQQLTDYNQRTALQSQKLMVGTLDGIKAQLEESVRLREAQTEDLHTLRTLVVDMNKDLTPHGVALKQFEQNTRKLKAISNQQVELNAKIARRLPAQTCTWIYEQDAFLDWYQSTDSAMLWISGGPGFGKSILMAAVIDELQKRASKAEATGHIVVYCFCNRGAAITRETDRILDHLLSQVYSCLKNSPTETLDKANKLVAQRLRASEQNRTEKEGDRTKFANVFSAEFASVFRGLVALLDRPVFAVVDALDECTDRSTGFVETLSAMVDTKSSCPGLKIAVCSRPEQDIQDTLGAVPTILVENNNGPDIKLNAESQLSGLVGWSVQEKQLACEKIVEKAGSYFRYVDLAFEFLKQPWQRPLSKHLERLPGGVNAFYEQIIQTTPPAYAELLRYSLTWTILGSGSVRVPEVIDAYSQIYTTAESFEHDAGEEEHTSDLQIHQIQAASVNLLLVDPKSLVIQQRHSTVSDYFLSRKSAGDVPNLQSGSRCVNCENSLSVDSRFDISERSGHLLIASTICGLQS
jgi:Cdc6-like AAA superfamily ATPase